MNKIEQLTEQELILKDMATTLSDAFLEYAGYNIQRRGVPDARDGLKWGARQILHAQWINKLIHEKPFKKAAKSVAAATGYSYTHGDTSAYGTLIRMAKPFAYRYTLQDCRGNYGTQMNPKDHAASRYAELRGSEIAEFLLKDIEKNTVDDWEDTYDLEGQFPKVLPSKGFYNLANGATAISSGMTVSIPQFNIVELNESLKKLLLNPSINEDDLIIMPDFCTGAILLNEDEVRQSLKKGYGFSCKLRSVIEFDDKERCLKVKELPYSVYTNTICNELANLIANDENCKIKNYVDYTKRKVDLWIYLDKKTSADTALKYLYKNTSLQYFFPINMNLLDNGEKPKTFGWKELLQCRINYEKKVYIKSFKYDLEKIENRIHIINGLLKAYDVIDEVITTIKTSNSSSEANIELQKLLNIDKTQAKAILDLKLSRLSKIDITKLVSELDKLNIDKNKIIDILNNEKLLNDEIIRGWEDISKKFGDARRTQILNIEGEEEEPREIKTLSINLTNKNNLIVNETSTLYTQRRNSVGSKFKLDKDEYISTNIVAQNNDIILFFTAGTNNCNCFKLSGADLPIEQKTPLEALLQLSPNEYVIEMTAFNKSNTKPNILFITKKGMIKKSLITEYNTKRKGGIKALDLAADDELISVLFIDKEALSLCTKQGRFLLCNTADIRPIGRVSKGIKGINLDDDDYVVSGHIVPENTKTFVSISESGYIKQTKKAEFNIAGRNTKGQRIQKLKDKQDAIIDCLPIVDQKEILVISSGAQLKIKLQDVPTLSKNTQGVKSIKIKENEKVVCLS